MFALSSQIVESPFFGSFLAAHRGFRLLRPWLLRVAPCWPWSLRARRTHLPGMSDDRTEILTPEQVADLLHVSPRTVEEWRRTRTGPPWRRMGRHVRYLRREVLVWFEELDSDD